MAMDILKKLGLSENEIKIYVTLLTTGPSSASEIAKLTKLHRTHVYDIFNGLEKKGIISFVIKENRKYYQASQPRQFLRLLHEKTEELEATKKDLVMAIAELSKTAIATKEKLLASIFQGKEGFKTVLNDILDTGKDYVVIGYTPKTVSFLSYILENFQRRRIKLGIKRRILMSPKLKGTPAEKLPLQQVKFLPKRYHIPMGITVYGDKTMFAIIEDDIVAIVIENKKIANNFRMFFEMLWKVSTL